MFIAIMVLIGYVIYMIGFIKHYRNPSGDSSAGTYLLILVICIAVGIIVNLFVVAYVDYTPVLTGTANVLAFEKHTGAGGVFLFGIGRIRQEIRYHVTVVEKDGKIVIYPLYPDEVEIYKTQDNQSRLEIYTAVCNSPVLQKLFIFPGRTRYKLFLQEEFLQK
jgi:hypothetical protein